ncbi:hypothetical protein SAMN02949497_1924 [Methylomagnum ishizawai]|uniref:Uncharacterized protein n=1 Tax=Methylomagnum ishizawai TaxID=1760988 RepID=A0A1Y6D185_9GAMM|nr:hypothetical protein [Methylomagnum ishizawai]SMF94603.1 hypothetical protein SAMN02949497_1924 [Methylomagnum ishizawai]
MTVYYTDRMVPVYTPGDGCAVVYPGRVAVSAAPAQDDEIRLVLIPAGTEVHRVVIKNPDLDSNGSPALAAKIGFAPADGTEGASGDDTQVKAAGAWAQAAATTTYELFPPVQVDVDSYLNIVVTTGPGTGATGTVYGKVEGRATGRP